MPKTLITGFIFFLFFSLGQTQTFSVKGVVMNSSTKETIPICNVYFSGSTIGTMTDAEGKFTIANVRPGTYDLIVSHINYDFKTYPIVIDNKDIDMGRVLLKEKPVETSYAEVKDKADRKWRRQFERFKRYILGDHFKERDIDIPNAYEAEFKVVGNTLIKKESFALEINNSFTGYKIFYPIQEFLLGQGTDQFMVGFPRFENMESDDEKEREEWMNNRKRSYNGSLRHFFSSLVKNNLDDDKFRVNITNISPVGSEVQKPDDYSQQLDPLNMPELFKIEDTKDSRIKKISYTGFLEVSYFGESSFDGKGQKTFIEAPEGHFYVFENGVILDPTSIVIYGYLSTEGLYEMLPFDFELNN